MPGSPHGSPAFRPRDCGRERPGGTHGTARAVGARCPAEPTRWRAAPATGPARGATTQRRIVPSGSLPYKGAMTRKVVLAYSGGLDTSVAVRWMKETYGCEIVCFCADIGQ